LATLCFCRQIQEKKNVAYSVYTVLSLPLNSNHNSSNSGDDARSEGLWSVIEFIKSSSRPKMSKRVRKKMDDVGYTASFVRKTKEMKKSKNDEQKKILWGVIHSPRISVLCPSLSRAGWKSKVGF
jgi:hypothetical protein